MARIASAGIRTFPLSTPLGQLAGLPLQDLQQLREMEQEETRRKEEIRSQPVLMNQEERTGPPPFKVAERVEKQKQEKEVSEPLPELKDLDLWVRDEGGQLVHRELWLDRERSKRARRQQLREGDEPPAGAGRYNPRRGQVLPK